MSGQQQLLLGTGVSAVANYIEDVFSTWLYTGTASTQTITNGIDLSTKGGLVWTKARSSALNHFLCDTVRGRDYYLISDATVAQQGPSPAGRDISSFNSNGYSLGINANADINTNAVTFASWTFRKQPKFFDAVTYTGNGGSPSPLTVSHSLGSVPGCVMIKKTNGTADWVVFHRGLTGGLGSSKFIRLNTTAAEANAAGGIAATSTAIDIYGYTGSTDNTNDSGGTYVMYLFAHNAGGFGLTGTDNVISCGSFTTDGSGEATVTLGYEPQWALIKPSNSTGDWVLVDTMRSWVVAGNNDALLYPNSSGAEVTGNNFGNPTATGFQVGGLTFSNTTYIYIAIRRGPMKTPTTGTSVFAPTATSVASGSLITTNFVVDANTSFYRPGGDTYNTSIADRLRGYPVSNASGAAGGQYLTTSSTAAEVSSTTAAVFGYDFWNTGWRMGYYYGGASDVFYSFSRAPGFFDVVCYTGTGSATTFNHNLGVAPELIITKCRGDAFGWAVYSSAIGNTAALFLETTATPDTNVAYWNNTTPTGTVFSVGNANRTNRTSQGMVAYLFASCLGVSKVGSYTGTGTTQQINCGFTGGARFVLIKRTDSTGDWYVWDSARGIVSGNDPYLLLNDIAGEVTGTDYVDTYSAGFEISSTAPAAINANGGTFIFLAIA